MSIQIGLDMIARVNLKAGGMLIDGDYVNEVIAKPNTFEPTIRVGGLNEVEGCLENFMQEPITG
ncbi:MAG: hypothetical protein NZ955_05510 [Candidatus Bathyarchaeota archaeon]|nr:hypothetical protein [Candidatus Bathyarchaeota archaeon]